MGERLPDMRASDAERQHVVEILAHALDEGRIKVEEYSDRMSQAYEAVTHADLARLHADLPDVGAAPPRGSVATSPAVGPPESPGFIADMPTALKVLWTIWLTAVSINVVVWVLVSITSGSLIYPWPLWVAGPSGAALGAVTAGATQIKRGRRATAARRAQERAQQVKAVKQAKQKDKD